MEKPKYVVVTQNMEPPGESKMVYGCMFMNGVGVLVAWNAILTALDWFNKIFPGLNPSFIFTILNFAPSVIFQPLTVKYGRNFGFNTRIVSNYIALAILLILTPIFSATLPTTAGFAVMCIISVLMGATNAIGQTTVFGLGGMLPGKYTNAIMAGNGMAGVGLNVIRIICLASFPLTDTGLFLSSLIYFIVAAVVLLICCYCQMWLMRNPFVQYYLQKANNPDMVSAEDEKGQELIADHDGIQTLPDDNKPTTKDLIKGVWQWCFLVWLCYFITFAVFPGVVTATNVDGLQYDWYSVLILTTFNLFDFIGRNLPNVIFPKPIVIWVMVFMRFFFWFSCIAIASDVNTVSPSWLWHGTWWIFINQAFFALSNGFTSTMCMIYGPSGVAAEQKDQAGYISATFLVWGIFSGSLMAIAFEGVGKIPN